MKISKVTFEGTPDEFKAIDYVFTDNPSGAASPQGVEVNTIIGPIGPKDAYRAMLKRIPVPNGQRDAYKALANGELEYGNYLRIMKRTWNQIAGLHGALGRRINNTKEIHQAGLPGEMKAIVTWRKDGDKEFLSLKPDFLEVLREEGIV